MIFSAQCTGRIKAIRYGSEGEGNSRKDLIYVALDTSIQENYTRVLGLQRPLIEAFIRQAEIHLITKSCQGEGGFADFEILTKSA